MRNERKQVVGTVYYQDSAGKVSERRDEHFPLAHNHYPEGKHRRSECEQQGFIKIDPVHLLVVLSVIEY